MAKYYVIIHAQVVWMGGVTHSDLTHSDLDHLDLCHDLILNWMMFSKRMNVQWLHNKSVKTFVEKNKQQKFDI